MKDDKKGVAALIISKMKGGGDIDSMKAHNEKMTQATTNEAGDEVDSEPGLSAAADEIVNAVKSGNSKGLKTALKAFVRMAVESEDKEEAE